MQIAAPALSCQKRSDFGGSNPSNHQRSDLSPTGLLYTAYSSIGEGVSGRPLAWANRSTTAPDFGTFTEIPTLWVGWLTQTDRYHSNVMECVLYNATRSFNVVFSGESLTMDQTKKNLIAPLLPEGSTKSPLDSDYQQFSGYYGAAYLYREFLRGNLTADITYGFTDNTDASQTNWFGATTGIVLSEDFAKTIEDTFGDFFISLLSATRLPFPALSPRPFLSGTTRPFGFTYPTRSL
ncbi:hypothetical protein F4808DRAFT_414999 [Astrocystis sublimbata]|nr:hypothetical protein F4808DRAFT_414999 [Astrocystis sublimbata]